MYLYTFLCIPCWHTFQTVYNANHGNNKTTSKGYEMNTAEIKQAAKRYMQDRYGIKGTELTAEFLNEVLKGVKRRYARPIETEVKAHIEMCMLYGWERGQKCLDDDKMEHIDVVKNKCWHTFQTVYNANPRNNT